MRYVKHTELPMDEPWPVIIRDREFEEQEHSQYGTSWTIKAALPRSNPTRDPDSDYDPEWIFFTTQDEKLVRAVEGALAEAPSMEAGDVVEYRVSIVRGKDGKKNAWKVLPGLGPDDAPPRIRAARHSQGERAELIEDFRALYRDILAVLLGHFPEPGPPKPMYKVTAAGCAAVLLAGSRSEARG